MSLLVLLHADGKAVSLLGNSNGKQESGTTVSFQKTTYIPFCFLPIPYFPCFSLCDRLRELLFESGNKTVEDGVFLFFSSYRPAEHKGLICTVRGRTEPDFNAGGRLFPGVFEEFRMNSRLSSLTMPRSRTHNPPVGFAVLPFHKGNHLPGGGHIRPVAVKDLKGKRQPFLCCRQTDAHLRTVRTAVAAVPSFCLGVTMHIPLKVGGGNVVEEEIEGGPEEFAVAFLEMTTQIILMGQKHIEGPRAYQR